MLYIIPEYSACHFQGFQLQDVHILHEERGDPDVGDLQYDGVGETLQTY